MVISSLTNNIIYPNQMAQLFKDNGFRANEGTSLNAFPWLGKKYELTCNRVGHVNDAVNCLHRGGMVICSCGAGLFSTGGHIIVLAGMKDANTIIVYDPYLYAGKFNQYGRQGKVTVDGNNVYCSMYNFQTYANCQAYFCYEAPAKKPDLRYNAHVQDIGWIGWQDAGATEGTMGESRRIEAVILEANNGLSVQYRAHVQDIGWQGWKNSGEVAGTTGESKRLEALQIKSNKLLEAQEYLQDVGWMPASKGYDIQIGTMGKSLRLEAFRIKVVE